MKRRTSLLAAAALLLAGLASTGGALAAPGDLDPAFGNGGTMRLGPPDGCSANAVRQQPDGKLVVAGADCSGDFLVVRLRPDGSLDAAFGQGGRSTTDIGTTGPPEMPPGCTAPDTPSCLPYLPSETTEAATDVVVAADGKIVAGGWTGSPQYSDFALVRYRTDGALDTSFGEGGRTVTSLADGPDAIVNVLLRPDGKIVAVGRTSQLGHSPDETGLARYRANGTLDQSFGTGGHVTRPGLLPFDAALDLAGNIIVVGAPSFAGPWDFMVARYRPDGSPDPTFGQHGSVTTDLGPDDDMAQSVAIQPDGAIVVAGRSGNKFVLARYRPDGRLDPTFGDGGVARGLLPTAIARVVDSVAVQSDGRILLAGSGHVNDPSNPARPPGIITSSWQPTSVVVIGRVLTDGRPDLGFGRSGMVTNAAATLVGNAIRQSDGRIVVAGSEQDGSAVVVLRLLSPDDGSTTPTTPSTTAHTDPPLATGGSPEGTGGTPEETGGTPATPAVPTRFGYWMVGADGKVYPFGDARSFGDAKVGSAEAVDLEPTPSGNGYWVVDHRGAVYSFGDAVAHGQADGSKLVAGEKVASLSATPTGRGYWIFTSRGRALTFGDAGFFGDVSTVALAGPVLDSIPTPTGRGYYMVGSDGGIFALGDARFYGSMGGTKLNAPVQSLVPDSDGVGYWLVASDGGIFAFSAGFKGSMGSTRLNMPITGMVRAGFGYLMVGEDGGIFDFSGTPGAFKGSLGGSPPLRPVASVAVLER